MLAKLEIKGTIELVTGMHIGGSSAFAAIGAVDSPVIRDTLSDLPMIPGSSLKGKVRTLLAKRYSETLLPPEKPDEDDERIKRLFGSAGGKGKMKASRLIFSDMIISNMENLKNVGVSSATEVKFENSIGRLSGVANPRQIERTIRGSKFDFSVIYNVENEKETAEDIKLLAEGFKLLEYDYLGGHGSRGYGKVKFENIDVNTVVGEIDENILSECKKLIKEVGC